MKKILTFLLMIVTAAEGVANVNLPEIFSDNMVLQRNSEVKIWGWAKPGEEVRIQLSWATEELKVKTPKNAYWEITLSTTDVRGPQEIKITGYNEIILRNVLLGEVWLVSGQSNMEWSAAAGITNAEEAIAGAENENIRFFTVEQRTSTCPQQDLGGTWVSSTPETMEHFSAAAYFFGKKLQEELGVPVGLINSSWGGTPAEVWMPSKIFENNPRLKEAASLLPAVEWGPSTPGSLYNAMVHPIAPLKLAGILWYQGESNTANADYYEEIFTGLIESWRNEWNEELPFFYAQIAPFDYGEGYAGVKVRDAQRRVLALPNTGMIMTSDIGNIHDIHPRNKVDVGLRFANLALAEIYGKDINAHAPLFERIEKEGEILKVYFSNAEGLHVSPHDMLSQFRIAGKDKRFFPAEVEVVDEVVHLSTKIVPEPVYVRFSWGNTSTSNIFNAAGLPASSFTTEY